MEHCGPKNCFDQASHCKLPNEIGSDFGSRAMILPVPLFLKDRALKYRGLSELPR